MYDAEARVGAEARVAARFQPLNMLFPSSLARARNIVVLAAGIGKRLGMVSSAHDYVRQIQHRRCLFGRRRG